MLWRITYIFWLVKDWEFCKLFSVLWSLRKLIKELYSTVYCIPGTVVLPVL
jgi:hypothetical protein